MTSTSPTKPSSDWRVETRFYMLSSLPLRLICLHNMINRQLRRDLACSLSCFASLHLRRVQLHVVFLRSRLGKCSLVRSNSTHRFLPCDFTVHNQSFWKMHLKINSRPLTDTKMGKARSALQIREPTNCPPNSLNSSWAQTRCNTHFTWVVKNQIIQAMGGLLKDGDPLKIIAISFTFPSATLRAGSGIEGDQWSVNLMHKI